ncbi:MAG: pyruvate, phosphate dikinase [Promethearchaeia archaeon]
MSDEKKYIYSFEEGNKDLKNLLGGKGANLAEMTDLGLNIPPGFTITTEACLDYFKDPDFMDTIKPDVLKYIDELEKKTGKKFGAEKNSLLLSVRSGAPVSMPGMMDTVLNLGLNDKAVEGLAEETNNPRFAYDAYRRFIQMFGEVVMQIEIEKFEEILDNYKKLKGPDTQDTDLTVEDLKKIIADYKVLYKKEIGEEFPQNPEKQLFLAINAVFDSWNNKRAKTYRKMNKLPNTGTAVNVQSMVFGNKNWQSGTGVAFTRDPSTGEKKRFGEYLPNAQGEDVVAGIRTPKTLEEMQDEFPKVYDELMEYMEKLEKHYRDMQDIEFTIENQELFLLQTRTGKRTPSAAVKIAVDRVKEGLISEEEAIMAIDPKIISNLLFKSISEDAFTATKLLAQGINASPGAVVGKAVFDADRAVEMESKDVEIGGSPQKNIILVRPQTRPDDIHGLYSSKGVLTQFGGKTSHAAVVARGMGIPAVVGAKEIDIDLENRLFRVNNTVIKEGDYITIDGTTGKIYEGKMPLEEPELRGEFMELLTYADEIRELEVRANADTPEDAKNALEFGAEGIGLVRTEHMFMEKGRIWAIHELIMAKNRKSRDKILAEMLPMQRNDFYEILKTMEGKPVTIRLLDPPLHEFLPSLETVRLEYQELTMTNSLAKTLLNSNTLDDQIEKKEQLITKIRSMSEENPMMGLRGCRLGITWPEINEMQIRAIFEAACQLKQEGVDVIIEVMIPLVGMVNELIYVKEGFVKLADEIIEDYGVDLDYKFGTMIEVPRAALTAAEIAKETEFFSFGTNDLTQMTFGYSRDDVEGKFLPIYLEEGIIKDNPFEILDRSGIGRLMKFAIKEARNVKPDLKCGICGEHGGEPSSVIFCHDIGLNYVSCSPFRIPVARLAAAQAVILESREN